MNSLMFECPKHGRVSGKPIANNVILRLGCGCEWIAVTGIGWLINDGSISTDKILSDCDAKKESAQ